MCVSFLGTIRRSLPTRALPVALTLFSPLAVSGMSLTPVCCPLSDHSVSPWRRMKTRGVAIYGGADELVGCAGYPAHTLTHTQSTGYTCTGPENA